MARSSIEADSFPRSFARHLVTEQRKAVLEALRDHVALEHTIGELHDAAVALGWADALGELSLDDLAAALVDTKPPVEAIPDADADEESDEESDEDEAVEEIEDEPVPRGRAVKTKGKVAKVAKVAKVPVAKGRATKPTGKAKKAASAPAKASTPAKASARGKAGAAKDKGRRKQLIDLDERMSLDEAAALFIPVIRERGSVTMQDLEEESGAGRRKLRFHIGQLVRHGYLERHGMGRGTYYTVA